MPTTTTNAPRPWPVRLRKELGRLTGIVVRLHRVRPMWPRQRGRQLAVDMGNAGLLHARHDRAVYRGARGRAPGGAGDLQITEAEGIMSRSGRKRTCARVETNFPDHKRLKRIPRGIRRKPVEREQRWRAFGLVA